MTSLVAEIRRLSGLTQEQFAERAGTSRTRLSAYENTRTMPELDTLERLAAVASMEVALAPNGSQRVADQVEQLRQAIRDGRVPDAVRLVGEMVAWVRNGVVMVAALDQEPAPLGDRRWDALLAGVTELLCRELGRPVPGWASSPARCLEAPWFVSPLRSLWPEIYRTTPAPLVARGVFLSGAALDSV
jgi:transcriptional regulator with XRE-family HTH domain